MKKQDRIERTREGIEKAMQTETTVRGLLGACLDVYHDQRLFSELHRASGISSTAIHYAWKNGASSTYTADKLLGAMGIEVGARYGQV